MTTAVAKRTKSLSKNQLDMFVAIESLDPHVLLMKQLTAGKSKFTLVSQKTGERFTYELRAAPLNRNVNWNPNNSDRSCFFVKVLTQGDNDNGFSYLGTLRGNPDSMLYTFNRTSASKIHASSLSYITIQWFLHHVFVNGIMPKGVEILWAASCHRCGRTLTVPESIKSGFGPECVGKL